MCFNIYLYTFNRLSLVTYCSSVVTCYSGKSVLLCKASVFPLALAHLHSTLEWIHLELFVAHEFNLLSNGFPLCIKTENGPPRILGFLYFYVKCLFYKAQGTTNIWLTFCFVYHQLHWIVICKVTSEKSREHGNKSLFIFKKEVIETHAWVFNRFNGIAYNWEYRSISQTVT